MSMAATLLTTALNKHSPGFHPVVPFDPAKDRLYRFDFTESNTDLVAEDMADTERFATYINRTLRERGARYGFGGYDEHRTLYARSRHFDSAAQEEPRRLHLGIDIW